MTADQDRREAIAAAVAAYDHANPKARLPRNSARLLILMFLADDVCRRSLEDLAGAASVDRRSLTHTLSRLLDAGFLTKQAAIPRRPNTYHLHFPPQAQP